MSSASPNHRSTDLKTRMPPSVRRTGAEFHRRNRNQKGPAVFVLLFLLFLPLFAFGPRVRRGWLAFWAYFAGGVLLGDTP